MAHIGNLQTIQPINHLTIQPFYPELVEGQQSKSLYLRLNLKNQRIHERPEREYRHTAHPLPGPDGVGGGGHRLPF